MSTSGIEGIMVETASWANSKEFWTQLGFKLDFETDHGSGRFSHPNGGPYVFVAERAEGGTLEVQTVFGVADSAAFEPPAAGKVAIDWKPRHWGMMEMLVRDPDGRRHSLQAPLPEGVEAPKDE
jgi:catechol 2,3-dioxygenase-like lactoylglutathione lyase family enzyme